MPKYLVERKVNGIGSSSPEQLNAVAQKSNEALRELEGQVTWQQSFVTDDASYCVYISPNEELIRKHAELAGIPADSIKKIDSVIDPSNGELGETTTSTKMQPGEISRTRQNSGSDTLAL